MKHVAWQIYFLVEGKEKKKKYDILYLLKYFWVQVQCLGSKTLIKKDLYTKFFFKCIFIFPALLSMLNKLKTLHIKV